MTRYDIPDTRIHWLCPRCYTLELTDMNNQMVEIDIYRSANDDDDFEENNDNMNEGIEGEREDSDEETDSESMDEEPGDVSFELEYRQNEAMEKLPSVFRLFNIDPIHDK
ncbi:unnamed protein product [Rotaria sordida]|uniref:Uncharacterized protein n=1 Tax=Rotaria sordida TaxID=392033 RepID=A0A816CX93_9BILA|nr:unnamed protein product [Rotaria sordida]CAF1627349.1 unnamed protein product [Rotaria sordida]